jgi:hypothetical protein
MSRFRPRHRGSAVILLMAAITVVSLVGAALVSISGTSIQSQLNTGNALRAYFLAESGLRFAELRPRPGPYYTVWTDENGRFRLTLDPPPPDAPRPIPSTGFRIRRTGCKLESIGVVRSDSVFESAQRLVVRSFNGMPCWTFDEPGTGAEDARFPEPCGASVGEMRGAGWEWRVCDGIQGGSLQFNGLGDYMETDFPPFCEIGDGAPFTIQFRARPEEGTAGVVMGVGDGFNRFSVGIDGTGDWYWAYGDQTGGGIPSLPGVWQRVTVLYDPSLNEVRMQRVSCPGGVEETVSAYGGNAVIPEPGGTPMLFVGAENRNGTPEDFWAGGLDGLDIVNAAAFPDRPELFCPGAAAEAFYPLDRDALDRSGPLQAGNGHDAVGAGADPAVPDRWDCPEGAFGFGGGGDYLRVPDDDVLDFLSGGTLALWIFPESFSAFSGLVHKGEDPTFTDEAYSLAFGGPAPDFSAAEDQLVFSLHDPGGEMIAVETPDALSLSEWVHVAVTWDPFAESALVLYRDGAPVAQASLDGFGPLRNSAGGVMIGAQLPDGAALNNYPFHGRMDDVLFFDRALSPEEIAELAADRPAAEEP